MAIIRFQRVFVKSWEVSVQGITFERAAAEPEKWTHSIEVDSTNNSLEFLKLEKATYSPSNIKIKEKDLLDEEERTGQGIETGMTIHFQRTLVEELVEFRLIVQFASADSRKEFLQEVSKLNTY